jgi:hypothetical protein
MDRTFIEEQIQQVKRTIEKLEKTKTEKESFRVKILEDAKIHLSNLEKLKDERA